MKRSCATMVLPSLLTRLKPMRFEEEATSRVRDKLESDRGIRDRKPPLSVATPNLSQFQWMENHGPVFLVDGSKINVLRHPNEFYDTLLVKTMQAKRRITMASLYLGTGEMESQLVQCLHSALSSRGSRVRLLMLLDHSRGLRGNPNSCTLLKPLIHNDRSRVALFHTPTLRGLLKRWTPDRWNELFSLQHMKIYVFDDSVVISGANLSHDYFTNRQDRYMCIDDCPALADHMHQLVSTLALFSLQLGADGSCTTHSSWKVHPFKDDEGEFKAKAREKVLELIRPNGCSTKKELVGKSGDTMVMPLVQLGLFRISQDEDFTKELLRWSKPVSNITMATGYFNLTDEYKEVMLKSSAPISIITAAPTVNGFYGARGVAGAIPSAYTHLVHRFFQQIVRSRQKDRMQLLEYERPGWTFHSKGLWMYMRGENTPSLTLIGSPNFGYRSVRRDVELQLAIATRNSSLKQQLHDEQESLSALAYPVSQTTFASSLRFVPYWVRCVTHFFKDYF